MSHRNRATRVDRLSELRPPDKSDNLLGFATDAELTRMEDLLAAYGEDIELVPDAARDEWKELLDACARRADQ